MKRADIVEGEEYVISSARDLYSSWRYSPLPKGKVVSVLPRLARNSRFWVPTNDTRYNKAVAALQEMRNNPNEVSHNEREAKAQEARRAVEAAWDKRVAEDPLWAFPVVAKGTGIVVDFGYVNGGTGLALRETREVRELYSTYLAKHEETKAARRRAAEAEESAALDRKAKYTDLLTLVAPHRDRLRINAETMYTNYSTKVVLTGDGLAAFVRAALEKGV